MVQVRKLVLAIAAASALSSGMANALGLGELTVKSALNQPLVAEIELTQAQDLNPAQVVPSLATSADFAQAGVARQAFLNDLTFTPVINADGKSILRITSTRPVRDPLMKFLVQVLWPNGRALREYSVVLEQPKAAPAAPAAPAEAPAQAPAIAPEPAQIQAPAQDLPPPAPAPVPATTAVSKPAHYTTTSRDTLWEIAAKVRKGGSIQQTMLAIQALNPDAFIDGNINRLKKGQVLRLPDSQQTTALPQPQAVADVKEQNLAWRQGRRLPTAARQVDATRRERAGVAPSKVETRDNLSLVAAGSKPNRKGAAGDSRDVANKLAVAQESLDTNRRENAELKSRLGDLQSQLDKLQRLIQLKNDQLAKMQAAGAAPGAVPGANPALPADLVNAGPEAAKPANEIAPEDALPVEGAQVTAATPDQPITVQPAPDVQEPESVLKSLLASPILLGLIGGAAVLLLLLVILFLTRRRNALQEAEKHRRMARALEEEADFAADMDMPTDSFEGLDVPPPSVKLAPLAASIIEPPRERPTDALEQAQVHIANGRFNQAVALLEEAIKEEPQRSDLRLALMEVHAQQGDRNAFTAQERKLIATGKNHAEVEQLKSRYPTMLVAAAGLSAAAVAAELDAKYVETLLADEPPAPAQPEPKPELKPQPVVAEAPESIPVLTPEPELQKPVAEQPAPEQAAPEPAAAAPVVLVTDPDEFDHAFDLSLDDLEAASPAHVADPTEINLDDLQLDEPEDFAEPAAKPVAEDLSFETLLQQQTEAKAEGHDDLADFDLDLTEEPSGLSAEDDFLLSLEDDLRDLPAFDPGLELDTPAAPKAPVDELQLPEDFDLSLADEIETDQATEAFASEIDDVNAELDRLSQSLEQPPIAKPFESTPTFTAEQAAAASEDEPEFDFLAGTDEAATKLDLARAYIEMGDHDGARDILDEVVSEGDAGQKTEARDMLSRLV